MLALSCSRDWDGFVVAGDAGGTAASGTGGSGGVAGISGGESGGSGGTGGTGGTGGSGATGAASGRGGFAGNAGESAGSSGFSGSAGQAGIWAGSGGDSGGLGGDAGGGGATGAIGGTGATSGTGGTGATGGTGGTGGSSGVAGGDCGNGIVDGNETDEDCGGGECDPCRPGLHCEIDRDCGDANNGTGLCDEGTCTIECDTGWENCNSTLPDCETRIDDSVANCGECATPCSSTSGQPSCLDGQCSMVSCTNGYDDCSADENVARDGCETHTDSSVQNCGDCGHACALYSTCHGGSCCPRINNGAAVPLDVGTCFRIRPERCDCNVAIQLSSGASNVTMRVYWDAGGFTDGTWTNANGTVEMPPSSAATAVVTAIGIPESRVINWWSSGCGGLPVPCNDITESSLPAHVRWR